MRPPASHATQDCCGRGCAECVWSVYWEEVTEYNKAAAKASGVEAPPDPFEQMERRLMAEKQQGSQG